MPTSDEGAITSTHVTSFQASIDDLLIGGRSNAPSSVIIATKQVINCIARIDEEVQAYEASGRPEALLTPDERERLHALKAKCNATLSNLTTAARNHATGHGLSPVSLLDAAASHISQTIIELVRLVHMRKAGSPLPPSTGQARGAPSSSSSAGGLTHSTSDSAASTFSLASQNQPFDREPFAASNSSSTGKPAPVAEGRSGFPQRLASLRQPESDRPADIAGAGRVSPAPSSRSRTGTVERSSTRSPDPSAYGAQAGSSRMNGSSSDRSLASTLDARNVRQQQGAPQQQQAAPHQQQDYFSSRGGPPTNARQDRPEYGDEDEQDDAARRPSYDDEGRNEQYDQTQYDGRDEEREEGQQADWTELKVSQLHHSFDGLG